MPSSPRFHYHLPETSIAQSAAEPRDSAKMLRWPESDIRVFTELPDFLNAGDTLVINSSKVIPARIFATRPSRGVGGAGPEPVRIELLLHQATTPTLTHWKSFAKPAKRLKAGDILTLEGGATATVESTGSESGQITLTLNLPPEEIASYLEKNGHTPLPPYIHTADAPEIRTRYQTVYANPHTPGSVAAPTAGLHFTPAVFKALKAKGVNVVEVTLHVGAGTFLNPTEEQIATKTLHAEWAEVTPSAAQTLLKTRQENKHIIAVGTTALRTLETWGRHGMSPEGFRGETNIFIQPGDSFAVANRLITNFHLPESSLLMLIAAFIGEENWRPLYEKALANGLRFFSFGDTSLLTRKG